MPTEILGSLHATTDSTPLPLYPEVACGFPSPAEPFSEQRLSLDELVRVREPSMFLVRAAGDSMVDAGIAPGDVIVVDRAREARHGDVVVACLGDEFTVKRLHLAPGKVILEPANRNYSPRVIREEEELLIWGVCTWNMHQLSP